jgi:hypothetical protein
VASAFPASDPGFARKRRRAFQSLGDGAQDRSSKGLIDEFESLRHGQPAATRRAEDFPGVRRQRDPVLPRINAPMAEVRKTFGHGE